MAESRPGSSDRLDSWKAIADHLGREVRTVRRWEQNLGLPVRRVAGHHFEWWAAYATVLDEDWKPRGTFLNAGWIERLTWIGPDRLVIAGFSNARDGGMVALLDANALDGSSPVWTDATFRCTSCGADTPLRYLVFPRSEINRVTGSQFNRARLTLDGERMLARTIEVPMDGGVTDIDALYELTPSLDVVRASYSDRYWDMHHALELQGKIHHSRSACPDRNGPRGVEAWDRTHGWRTIALNR